VLAVTALQPVWGDGGRCKPPEQPARSLIENALWVTKANFTVFETIQPNLLLLNSTTVKV
jgi:hypothetical protein